MRGKTKMSLEEYMDFCESLNGDALTMSHLNQIISLHGFTKIYKHEKPVLVDAVRKLDLMVSFRSTLKEEICSNAFLTVEEVVEHLSTLQWQECSVKSIETLSSGKENIEVDDLVTKSPSSIVSAKPKNSKLDRKVKAREADTIASSVQPSKKAGILKSKRKRVSRKAGTLPALPASTAPRSLL